MFDLDAYLARIAMEVPPPRTPEGLAMVQHSHRLAIPFENLDVALGRRIQLDSAAVFDKLVTRRRGGICFEHNQLFLDGLSALGFEARPLLARVWLGAEHVPPQTHALALVTFGHEEWIADAGFGGGYAPPMPLADGEEVESADGATHRLARDPLHGWMLSRSTGSPAPDGRPGDLQYSFTLAPAWPADIALGNHWIQTSPDSRFVQKKLVSIALPKGYAGIEGRAYRRRNGDQSVESEIADPRAYRLRLSMMFGIDVTAEEVTALGLFD